MSEVAFADTNLFIRLFVKDDTNQAEAVLNLLRQAQQNRLRLITSVMTIAEIVWVLERIYKLNRLDIREHILSITNTTIIQVEFVELVIQAIDWYVLKNIDFIDAYNIAWMRSRSITIAYSFDHRHFSRIPDVTVIVPGQPAS